MDELYRDLLKTARQASRRPDEARDLVQDALAEALDRGFADWDSPARRAWLRGVVRRRAALVARTAVRRRRREASFDAGRAIEASPRAFRWSRDFLATLPASVRAVAGLASADLTGAEIRYALGITDTAFRQRLCALRGALRRTGDADAQVVPEASPGPGLGARRAELIATLQRRPAWALAVPDPDGHPIILWARGAHGLGSAGNGGSSPHGRPPRKEPADVIAQAPHHRRHLHGQQPRPDAEVLQGRAPAGARKP